MEITNNFLEFSQKHSKRKVEKEEPQLLLGQLEKVKEQPIYLESRATS